MAVLGPASVKAVHFVVYYTRMKILIASPSSMVANELKDILESADHSCIVPADRRKTVEDVYINSPDLIVLDVAMTRPSVYTMMKQIKAAPSTRDIPVLIIASVRSMVKIRKCFNMGAYDYISRPFFTEEILSRIRNIAYVADKMKEVEKLLVRDYLTGLYNRKFFMERLFEEIAWSDRYSEPLSFIILDIDHFKKINDTYGHSCGDEVLRELALVLGGMLRAHDVLARYGGEEFVVLLSNTTTRDAYAIGEKLRAGVEGSHFYCDEKKTRLPVTISLGVATTDESHNISFETLIKMADEALYQAKAAGRNRVFSAGGKGLIKQNEG